MCRRARSSRRSWARRERPHGARVLIIAAGGASDLRLVQHELAGLPGIFVLVDQDQDALDFAVARLPVLAGRLTTVCRNVMRGLASVRSHGPFDLAVAGGLFDYLPDTAAVGMLRYVRERLLAPAGTVLFTNIAAGNPYRSWIESMGSWRLIHRTPDDVVRLCTTSGMDASAVRVSRDKTDLALIVRCTTDAVGPDAG